MRFRTPPVRGSALRRARIWGHSRIDWDLEKGGEGHGSDDH